jgi:protein-S-isoprenylcysteine O-methyltransferase Ste14
VTSKISTRQIAIRLATGIAILLAAFFGSAGTLAWPEAWLYIIIQYSFSTIFAIWLKKYNPELLRDRMAFLKPAAKRWDKAILLISTVVFVPYLILPGLDAVRFQWSSVPPLIKIVSFVGIILSYILLFWVMRENSYLSRIVEIQTERGHRVITTGPYQYVRHPMYFGVIVLFNSIPVALGSLWTLIPSSVLTLLILIRTYLEDKTLREELEGYNSYAEKVKYKIIPGIW